MPNWSKEIVGSHLKFWKIGKFFGIGRGTGRPGLSFQGALSYLFKERFGVDPYCGKLSLLDGGTNKRVEVQIVNGAWVIDSDPCTQESYCAATYTVPNTAVQATAVLTATGNPAEGDTATVGGQTYTFTATVDAADKVLIGASASDTLDNLIAAVNAGAGAGTLYGTGTTANTSATAAAGAGDTVDFTAILYGVSGDSIASTTTGGGNATFAATTFVYAGTEDILVDGVALASTYEIESANTLSPASASLDTLASETKAGFTAAGVTPVGVTATLSGLTYIVKVTIDATQLAALTAIDYETDSSGALTPADNC